MSAATQRLPQRNLLIRLLYGLGLLSMFSFIGWIVQPQSSYLAMIGAVPAAVAAEKRADAPQKFSVTGVSTRIDLNQPVEPQLEPLWQRLEQRDYATLLDSPQPQTLYLVYSQLSDDNQQVTVTAGYRSALATTPAGLRSVAISGHYQTHTGTTVLDSWNNPQLQPALRYATDYERYQLNPDFTIRSQSSWLSVEAP